MKKNNPTPQTQRLFKKTFNKHSQQYKNNVNEIEDINNKSIYNCYINNNTMNEETEEKEDICIINTTYVEEESDTEEYINSISKIQMKIHTHIIRHWH